MAVLDSYSPTFRRLLEGVPDGMPRHDWINKVAFYGARHRSEDRLKQTLLAIADKLGWHDTRDFTNEIKRACRDAHRALASGPSEEREPSPEWPAFNAEARKKREGKALFAPEPCGADAWGVWRYLFAPGSLVCCGAEMTSAETAPLEEWADFYANAQFIVPNAMRAKEGKKAGDGKMSQRCRGNACRRRRWIVAECDLETPLEEQAAVLSSLDHPRCPLRLAVWSGGKSVHGWFDGKGLSDAEQLRWFRHAVYLGHDQKLWLKWQWVRAPGGRRDNGNRQEIFYFKPE